MRNPTLSSVYLFLLFSVISLQSFGQGLATDVIREAKIAAFSHYAQTLDGERVYLHTDRPRYAPGHTIWYQAYVRADVDLAATHQSDVLKVELFDPRGNAIHSVSILVKNGVATGDFNLGTNLAGGIYKLRAHSNWQQNDADPFYFEKEIMVSKVVYPAVKLKLDFDREAYGPGDEVIAEIILESLQNQPLAEKEVSYSVNLAGKEFKTGRDRANQVGKSYLAVQLPKSLTSSDGLLNVMVHHEGKTESISRSIPIVLNNLRVELFPEGGELVAGNKACVAFQGWNEHNKPADFSGRLVNSKGEAQTTFDSYHMGMGSFTFLPQGSESYAVEITRPAGVKGRFPLPKIQSSGLNLSVEKGSRNTLKATIRTTFPNSEAILITQVRGKVYHSQTVNINGWNTEVSIPTEEMPAGVAQVTLMDKSGIAYAERLAFVNKSNLLNIEIETDKEEYLPREKVSLKIKTKDVSGKALPAQVSLAVVNDKILSFADDKQGNLLSTLLLEADIKGEVDEPNFYFDPKEEKADLALDLLLMTRGWRKFEWKAIESDPVISVSAEKRLVSGYVYDYKGRPLEGVEINTKGNPAIVYSASDGSFILPMGPNGYQHYYSYFKKKGYQQTGIYRYQVGKQASVFMVPDGKGYTSYNSYYGSNYQSVCYADGFHNVYPGNEVLEYTLNPAPVAQKKFRPGPVDPSKQNTINTVIQKAVPKKIVTVNVIPNEQIISQLPGVVSTTEEVALSDVVITSGRSLSTNNIEMSSVRMESVSIIEATAPWQSGYIQFHVDGMDVWVGDGTGIALRNIPRIGNWNPQPPRSVPPKPKNYQEIKERIASHPAIASNEAIGKVKYRVLVGTRGQIERVVPLGSGDPVLFEAANWHIQNLDFKPAWCFGSRRPTWTTIQFDFIPPNARPSQRPNTNIALQQARVFSSPVYATTEGVTHRSDYRETLFWKGEITTDENGEAEIVFYNSDEVTSFRATAEGISASGLPGRSEATFHTQLPLSLAARIPTSVSTGDLVKVPLTITNNTVSPVTGQLSITYPPLWEPVENLPTSIEVAAKQTKVEYLGFRVKPGQSAGVLEVKLNGSGLQESVRQIVQTEAKGFPQEAFVSGAKLDQAWDLEIGKPLEGSLTAHLTAYPNVVAEAMEGMASMLRYPSGCFEQTTSKNWPNLLVTRYLIESGSDDLATKKKAIDYLHKGYHKLAGYEASSGGFDWYGRSPGNLRLSAYGLLQFSLTDQLIGGVSKHMIHRTEKWVLSHRDGEGNFLSKPNRGAKTTPELQAVTNAYLIFALARSGNSDLDLEISNALEAAHANKDPYQMALLANACHALGRGSDAQTLVSMLQKAQKSDGRWEGKSSSMVGSGGTYLNIETTALACMALMKAGDNNYQGEVRRGIQFIYGKRNPYGSFGATQTTAMALEALVDFSLYQGGDFKGGNLELVVNGKIVDLVEYSSDQRRPIKLNSWGDALKVGKNSVRVRFVGTDQALPFSLGATWNTNRPVNNSQKELSLTTTLSSSQAKVGETVRYAVNLKNTTNNMVGNPIALIGIPAGLSVQDWQLKELKEKGLFDFYEIKGQYIVLYYESMDASQTHLINLDLKAEVPGNFEAPASSAYLYYNETNKDWASAGAIELLPR